MLLMKRHGLAVALIAVVACALAAALLARPSTDVDLAAIPPPLPAGAQPAPVIRSGPPHEALWADTSRPLPAIPPHPTKRAPAAPPKFLRYRDVPATMSSIERIMSAKAVYATPGPAAEAIQGGLYDLPPDELLAAQLELSQRLRAVGFEPRSEATRLLLPNLSGHMQALWADGADVETLSWWADRYVDVNGALGDGPPRPEVTKHLACPIAAAALTCEELGYRNCDNAKALVERASSLCASAE